MAMTDKSGDFEQIRKSFDLYNDYTPTKQQLILARTDPTGPPAIAGRLVAGRSKGTPLPKPPSVTLSTVRTFDPASDARKVFRGKYILPLNTAQGGGRGHKHGKYDYWS